MKIHATIAQISVLAMLSVVFCSCSKEVVEPEVFNPETYIGFNLPAVSMSGPQITEMSTRSDLFEYEFPEGESFGVLGYCKSSNNNAAADWLTKYQFVSPNVFYKKEVTYSNGVCTYSGLVPWDEITNSKYTFFAYYPYNGSFSIEPANETTPGAPKLTYTMPFDNGNNGTLSLDDAVDAMVAYNYDHTRAQGNVDFDFRHLMTAIRFKVNNYDDETPVKINTIQLSGAFYRSVTIDYTPVANAISMKRNIGTDRYNGTYDIYNDSFNPYVVDAGRSVIVGDFLLLLPGIDDDNTAITGLGDNVAFSCNYMFMNDYSQEGGSSLNYTFEPGTRYTINLNFIGDSFTVNITSDAWENGSDNEITIQ